MSKFAKGINKKNAKAITRKCFFFKFHKVIYSLPSINCPTFELLVVTVFDISSFLCQNLQRAITHYFLFSPSSLLINLYKLTKFEDPSCNGFLRYQGFYV